MIVLYLLAVVLANLTIAYFGPIATPIVGFVCIGLDLTARDTLHERWRGNGLWPKMFALIATGSLLSFLINYDAGRIALASMLSFLFAGLADAIVYHVLGDKSRFLRINGSNVVSATVDSIAFPTIAFGTFIPWVVVGQLVAKTFGGLVWSLILTRFKR